MPRANDFDGNLQLTKKEFLENCQILYPLDELATAYPNWDTYPKSWKLGSGERCELLRRCTLPNPSPRSNKHTVTCQFIFKKRQIDVALYLTELNDDANVVEVACNRLAENKECIKEQCGVRLLPEWDRKKGKRTRFWIQGHRTEVDLVKCTPDESDVARLVKLMFDFQNATFPLVGL